MYTLTPRRYVKATVVLEKYREMMLKNGEICSHCFEMELRKCWNTGYREIKDIMEQLLKDKRYVYVAAFYMENSNAAGVVSEFKGPLADLYGATDFHYDKSYKEKRDAFWEKIEE